MGYSTDFTGILNFKKELTTKQIAKLHSFLGEDCREHPSWPANLTYIDLQFTPDFDGLEWNGAEKTYNLVEIINFITSQMQILWPDFSMTGSLFARGEEPGDVWQIVMIDGIATRQEVEITHASKIKCPHCGASFSI